MHSDSLDIYSLVPCKPHLLHLLHRLHRLRLPQLLQQCRTPPNLMQRKVRYSPKAYSYQVRLLCVATVRLGMHRLQACAKSQAKKTCNDGFAQRKRARSLLMKRWRIFMLNSIALSERASREYAMRRAMTIYVLTSGPGSLLLK